MKKLVLWAAVAIVVLVAAFYAFNNYIHNEKQGDETGANFEPYRGTLSGEYVCLPLLDASGPETDECVRGIKTEVGEYYALDFNMMSQTPPKLSTGDTFKASGVITPIERLSTDHWQQYPVEGIFSVTDSVEKL